MAASNVRSYMMVAEAAAEILSQKLEILLYHPVPIRCLYMENLANDAKQKLATIQEFLSTQDRQSKSTEWLGRLLQAMYGTEEFIDKFHLREAHERHKALYVATRPLAMFISKCMLRKDLSNLVNMLQELCQHQFLTDKEVGGEREKDASVPWQGPKLARFSFWDRQALTDFVCHEAKKKEIMKCIEEGAEPRGVKCISIWGKQGTGKTFLARSIYRQAMFIESCAWVHVSGSLDTREILLEILKQVGKLVRDVEDMNLEDVMEMLIDELTKRKSFFIVLDDVHLSDLELRQSLLMIMCFHWQGCIITTTRDKSIAKNMTFDRGLIKLEHLGDPESQNMLAGKLHRVPEGQRLSKEKDILNTCQGLPLYISLFGGLLSNAEENECAALVKDCSKLTLFDVLQLSYNRLPLHLKPCFIYMALFPVASPIPTRRLVRLWLAEGLLDSHCYDREKKRTRQPEDVGETFILELADRNVIDVVSWRADGSPKACQMVTSLYDMIRPVAMSTGFLHIHAAKKSKHGDDYDPTGQQQQLSAQPQENKVRWLAEHMNIVREGHGGSHLALNLSHVRSFLSFYPRRGMLTKDISTILRNMTSKTDYSLLNVLDLEGVYKPPLQGVLHKLVLLRYLGLRSTVLDSIPSAVADLQYLQTLDIKHTNITSLPSSLWEARNLRHLHLNWFYIDLKKILKACSHNAMALTQLQTLSGLVIGEVTENLMAAPMDSLTTLTKLKFFLQRSNKDTSEAGGKTVADWISSELTNLQSLTFGVIQEAMPVKEAEPAEEDEPVEELIIVAKPAKEATKVAQSSEEAQPSKETQAAEEAKPAKQDKKEATNIAKPTEKAQPAKVAKRTEEAQLTKEAKPVKSQIGLLPKLSLAQHHELMELYLLGQLDKPIWIQLLPVSLRVLTLSGSNVKTDMMPELGGLLRNLRTLRLLANSFLCESMSFVKDGFPSLKSLKIWKLPKLVTVNIEQGAMLHLKELEFRHLDRMEKVEGIHECKELENICVVAKKGARDFVDHLKDGKGYWKIVYEREATERSGPTDDD